MTKICFSLFSSYEKIDEIFFIDLCRFVIYVDIYIYIYVFIYFCNTFSLILLQRYLSWNTFFSVSLDPDLVVESKILSIIKRLVNLHIYIYMYIYIYTCMYLSKWSKIFTFVIFFETKLNLSMDDPVCHLTYFSVHLSVLVLQIFFCFPQGKIDHHWFMRS